MSGLHVVFGAGPVGRSVVEALVGQGKPVHVVTRSRAMPEAPQGVELVAADLYDPARVRQVTQGAAVVYQCAQPKYWEWPEKFPPLQAAIIEGLAGSGARLVIAENLYMYGDPDGEPLTEELPYKAHTRKGKVRAEMSAAAFAAHRSGKVQVTVGRASDFFGPWALSSSHGERVFYPALAGKSASFPGKLDMPHTATFIGDFGRALALLGERDEALGQVWHVPNDQPRVTQRQFAELIFEDVGLPPKVSGMGRLMLALAGLFVPGAREMVEMMYEFEKPFVVDSTRFERTFGMTATPLRDAIRQSVAWYRGHPQG
jgi:nucleoside-diphosphate-sugar epimerase